MRVLNLTSHPLDILNGDGYGRHLPVGGPRPSLPIESDFLCQVAVELYDEAVMSVDLCRETVGEPQGLPEPEENVLLVVDKETATHPSVTHRKDLVYPGQVHYSHNGNIVGHMGLCTGPGLAKLSTEEWTLPEGWFGGLGQ